MLDVQIGLYISLFVYLFFFLSLFFPVVKYMLLIFYGCSHVMLSRWTIHHLRTKDNIKIQQRKPGLASQIKILAKLLQSPKRVKNKANRQAVFKISLFAIHTTRCPCRQKRLSFSLLLALLKNKAYNLHLYISLPLILCSFFIQHVFKK